MAELFDPDLLEPLVRTGAKAPHLTWLQRTWLSGEPLRFPEPGCELPLPLASRAAFEEVRERLEGLVRVASEHPGDDGGVRLLSSLEDGRAIESVLLARGGVCVSTQLGCAVGCTFCMTGREGLLRQLTVAEILAQVVVARRRRAVRRVVFMGMGEPAHNLDAVLRSMRALGTLGGIGHKDLVFSTVGEPAVFERLRANAVRPGLALSLHTTDGSLRRELLPRAPRVEPRVLFEAAMDYADDTGYPLQLQWTLIDGVNDGEDELARLLEWVRGRRVLVNYIPFNAIPDSPYAAPPAERRYALLNRLRDEGVQASLRQSLAGDVDGACGQLRARRLEGTLEGEG